MSNTAHPPLPRGALTAILVAAISHVSAVFVALRSVQAIPAWHWALLLCTDAAMSCLVIQRGSWFLTRNFRLPGIFVVSTYVIILTPLPATVRRYRTVVPYQTVLSITAGLAVLIVVMYILTARRPSTAPVPVGRTDAIIPWSIVVAAVVILPIWIRAIGSVPLFQLFGSTDAIKAAGARDQALDSLSSGGLRTAVGGIRNLYLMFAAGYIVSRAAKVTRAEWRAMTRWRAAAGGVVVIAAIYALLTTERAILGELVIVAVVAWLVSRRRRLSVRHIVISSLIGLAFPVMFAVLVGSGGFGAALTGLRRRTFYLPDDVMLHYFIAFPRYHAFLEGAGVPKLGRFTGTATFDLSAYIYNSYYKVDASLTGIANGSFLGVGWANWGTVGVVVFCVASAAAVVGVERILRKLAPANSAALRGVAVVQTALLTSSDINRSLLGFLPGFLDIVAVLFIARGVDRRFNPLRRSSATGGSERLASSVPAGPVSPSRA